MKVCYFGTYREKYSRNKIMIAALRIAGAEVKECHVTLWHGIKDRVDVTVGGWKSPRFWWRVIRAYVQLIWKYFKVGDYNVMMVGYPGHFDVFLAKILVFFSRKPLVWDVFMSLYLVSLERNLDQQSQFSVNLLKKIEARALRLPDLLIQDTVEYVNWFQRVYGISPEKFRLIPTGADDRIFKPVTFQSDKSDGLFHVLYYGTFIPNHGIRIIVGAAELLRDEKGIIFELIGDGPERKVAEEIVKETNLKNVKFIEWMDQKNLIQYINRADVCLGAFGDTLQSLMTVQNKIYECMAMGKTVITGDSPVIRGEFTQFTDLIISERNSISLAGAITLLKGHPEIRKKISMNSFLKFKENYSLICIGKKMIAFLEKCRH